MQHNRFQVIGLPSEFSQVVDNQGAGQTQAQQQARAAQQQAPAAVNIQQALALQQLQQQQLAAAQSQLAGMPAFGVTNLQQLANLQAAQAAVQAAQFPSAELNLLSQFQSFLTQPQPQVQVTEAMAVAAAAAQLPNMGLNLEQLKQDNVTRSNPRSRSETGTSSAYASRHQAAEQRRRTRINERLERLRKIVPHAERANTATFLEEVINYIERLKKEIAELKGEAVPPSTEGTDGGAAGTGAATLTEGTGVSTPSGIGRPAVVQGSMPPPGPLVASEGMKQDVPTLMATAMLNGQPPPVPPMDPMH